jgi:hypothetical protein
MVIADNKLGPCVPYNRTTVLSYGTYVLDCGTGVPNYGT